MLSLYNWSAMSKFTIVAYFLWLVFGYFGVHHFYLGRDKQGILWLTSFGGIFCLGWIRDFYRIPSYVREANKDHYYLESLAVEMRHSKSPSLWKNSHRILAQLMFGYFYRSLIRMAIPEEFHELYLLTSALLPLGSALGTHVISNIGHTKSRFKYSLMGAYLGEVLFGELHIVSAEKTGSFAVGVSMLFSTFDWQWDRAVRQRKGCGRRLGVGMALFLVYTLLCSSYVYHNMTVNTKDGESLKVREVIHNFFKSPHWARLKSSLWKVYEEYRQNGWDGAKQRLTIIADFEGEDRARTVLGVANNATHKEVKDRYRELAKVWHPDKHHGDAKDVANERFMEIKEAYETLDALFTRRDKHWRRPGHSYR